MIFIILNYFQIVKHCYNEYVLIARKKVFISGDRNKKDTK